MMDQVQRAIQEVSKDGIVFGPIFKDFATAEKFYKRLPYFDSKADRLRPKTHLYVIPGGFRENEEWTAVITGGALSVKERQRVFDLWKKYKPLDSSFIITGE